MKFLKTGRFVFWAPVVMISLTLPIMAQDAPVDPKGTQVGTHKTPSAASNAEELRNQSQNPIANLISVPFQNNTNFNIGPANRVQNVLNIQPVIPFSLSRNWNLITRWITPIVYQPLSVSQPPGPPVQLTGAYGLGDLNPSFFISPKKGKIIWGVGPTFIVPTATNTAYLGQGKLSMGPSVVALVQPPHFTIGFLANNVWSVAGHANINKPAVNQFLLQWFVNYNMKKGWYLVTAPIITNNWRATDGNGLTLPFGGGAGRVMKMGFQPVSILAEFFGNAIHPPGTSPWGMRFQFTLLFPRLNKEEEEMLLEQRLKQIQQSKPTK